MANPLKFIYGTEAQILALTPTDSQWVERAFYYPENKDYFYQALNGIMKKYGSGGGSAVGAKLNGETFGGAKTLIESSDILDIPENYEYSVHRLNISGRVNLSGEINLN